ncbi:TonB C-terminal domain-containing protein [Helicobacter pylori]|uniref:energy transducer TonB n=1 Tax=Helicobacter pylori TaxID=210 RepID=UPI000426DBC1|nr:energy transducer TonB [Helicobacter pylori]MCQ2713523.1 TonB C-terminal domain-containing protein [Helicobacter pylori]RVY10885.1 TonB C-terminal domain-containing protein [Helicobacter pylori]RVY13389.1 TonB C-terminal domain-containing protein [Helicobacter pylori]RVY17444.1 TonB C-terminal domain-containing protein [Helicobacter pylori]RVY90348.1 TonB C-terminal domain-containing protein [Helicobacter pylori]
MSKSAIFVVSGFLAFLLYALLLYGLLLERHNKEAEKILLDLGKKNEQVIDLNLEDLPSDEKKDEKIAEKAEEKKDEKVVEKNATDKEGDFIDPKEQEESLEDIFSSLNDFQEKTDTNAQKDDQKNEQEEEQRRLKEQQRLKQNQKNQEMLKGLQQNLDQFAQKLESVKNKTLDLQIPKQDGVDEKAYQEWYAQIYQILYKGWKGVFYHKASVSALIMITKDGEFDYTILSYSDFKDYNKSVMTLLNDLKKVDFPPYPGGNMISIQVNFTTKEEQ